MPRFPKPRGFDITDKDDDCYDATGQFGSLTRHDDALDADEPRLEAADVADDRRGARGSAAARREFATRGGAVAITFVAALAVLLVARSPERPTLRPMPSPTPATARPAPRAAVAATSRSAAATPKPRAERPRSRPRRTRRRPARPQATAPTFVAPRPVAKPVPAVRRPLPTPAPAGEEFILGAP